MKSRLFRQLTLRDLLLVMVLVGFVFGIAHFVIANPLGPARLLYPLEALVARQQLSCSPGAPKWLGDSLRFTTQTQGSLANQIVFLDPAGQLHHCENGWTGDLLRSEPVAPQTRFRYASITKLFTADAVLALINAGRLSLESRLLEYLPEVAELELRDDRLASVTIEQLLNHSAGFDRSNGQDPMFLVQAKPWCPGELTRLAGVQLSFDPGSRRSYSNLGYCLLGVVLERVTGQSYRDYIEHRYHLAEDGLAFVDGPYLPDEVRYDFRHSNFYGENYHQYFDFQAISSAAGLSGSASALARQVQAMIHREPLSVISGKPQEGCDEQKFRRCYGYVGYHYRQPDKELSLLLYTGYFPGNASLVMVDSRGGITVWLSSGNPLEGARKRNELYRFLHDALERHYQASDGLRVAGFP